jgi:hypothetical protein
MNAGMLDLPPRRELPADVRDRMHTRIVRGMTRPVRSWIERSRTPLAAAAAVAVLAASAAIVAQSVGTSSDDSLGVAGPSSGRPSTSGSHRPTFEPLPPLSMIPADAPAVTEDLDRCAAVASASPRAGEFAPREAWQAVYAVELTGHRITAFTESGGKPGFCDTTARTATVSDPSAPPMSLGQENLVSPPTSGSPHSSVTSPAFDFYGLYLSDAGVLAGFAQGVHAIELFVSTRSHGQEIKATMRDGLFMAEVGDLQDGDFVATTAKDPRGQTLGAGAFDFDRSRVRPVGATAVDRP